MATSNLSALLSKVPLTRANLSVIAALVSRYGLRGAVALARGYLGPDAPPDTPPAEQPAPDATGATSRLSSQDGAVLGLALTKLLYELGELALHNPELDPDGKQPQFKLDAKGRPPAMSITHVLAAARFVKAVSAERKLAAEQTEAAPATPRARLQAARAERYATSLPRYSYVARPISFRTSR